MSKNFNRTYRTYLPGSETHGPPTQRICRPDFCANATPKPNPKAAEIDDEGLVK